MDAGTLITELKRRRVFRVLVGYGICVVRGTAGGRADPHALGLSDAVLTCVVLRPCAGGAS